MTPSSSRAEASDTEHGAKYTYPTGPGYIGVYSVRESSTTLVSIGSQQHLDWGPETDLWAATERLNGQLVAAIIAAKPRNPITEVTVHKVDGNGPDLGVPPEVAAALEAAPVDEIRVYRRAGGGIYVVPRHADPTLGLSGNHPKLGTDAAGDTPDETGGVEPAATSIDDDNADPGSASTGSTADAGDRAAWTRYVDQERERTDGDHDALDHDDHDDDRELVADGGVDRGDRVLCQRCDAFSPAGEPAPTGDCAAGSTADPDHEWVRPETYYTAVEDLTLDELRREYGDLSEQHFGHAATVDTVRMAALWNEIKARVDVEQPKCPECGARDWAQEAGGPKYCNECDYHPIVPEDRDLIEAIDAAWSAMLSPDEDLEVVTDGGTPACGRRTCDRDAALSYTNEYGALRTRCARHALADGVDGVGESRAETLLDAMSLADLVETCDGYADESGGQAPVALSRLDGIGPTTAGHIAAAIDDSPVAEAVRRDPDTRPDAGGDPA